MNNESAALDEKPKEALLRFEYQQAFAREELLPRAQTIKGVRWINPGQKLAVFTNLGDTVEYKDVSVQEYGLNGVNNATEVRAIKISRSEGRRWVTTS